MAPRMKVIIENRPMIAVPTRSVKTSPIFEFEKPIKKYKDFLERLELCPSPMREGQDTEQNGQKIFL